jgi:hypothetical protein
MKKSDIYQLAILYKTNLEQQEVKFSTARAIRDIFKPLVEMAIEVEEDLKKISDDSKELDILLNEEKVIQPPYNFIELEKLLDEYKISASNLEILCKN